MGDLIGDPQAAKEILGIVCVLFGLLCAGGAVKYGKGGDEKRNIWISIGFGTAGAVLAIATTVVTTYFGLRDFYTISIVCAQVGTIGICFNSWLRLVLLKRQDGLSHGCMTAMATINILTAIAMVCIQLLHYMKMVS